MNWYKIAKKSQETQETQETQEEDYIDQMTNKPEEEVEDHFQQVLNDLVNKSEEERNKRILTEKEKEDKLYDLFDEASETKYEILQEFIDAPKGSKQPWTLIPYARIKKIWNDSAREGFVRDTKGMDDISQQMIKTTLRLVANTELMGHTMHDPDEDFEDHGINEEQKEDFYDYATDDNGQYRLSDYGLKPLEHLALQLYTENTPEKQLLLVDKMLNIVHQRSDLASWYIEGGFTSLNELAGKPMSNYDYALNSVSWYKIAQEKKEPKVLYIMRGLPGSGKSTLAEELGQGGVVLASDDFFMVNGEYLFDPEGLGYAHFWNQGRVEEAMKQKVSPIVADNTNVQKWEMKPYVELALAYGYSIEFKEPNTPWKFDKEELFNKNTHGVPLEVIQSKLDKWDHDVNVGNILESEKPEKPEKGE